MPSDSYMEFGLFNLVIEMMMSDSVFIYIVSSRPIPFHLVTQQESDSVSITLIAKL